MRGMDRPNTAVPFWAALVTACLLLVGCPPRLTEDQKLVRDGNDYFDQGAFGKAEDAYSAALELKPREPGILTNRGNARMMAGDLDGARIDYEAALAVDPQFARAYANRGILEDRTGNPEAAMEDYRKALDLDPALGKGPAIWERILYGTPNETVQDRLEYLQAARRSAHGE